MEDLFFCFTNKSLVYSNNCQLCGWQHTNVIIDFKKQTFDFSIFRLLDFNGVLACLHFRLKNELGAGHKECELCGVYLSFDYKCFYKQLFDLLKNWNLFDFTVDETKHNHGGHEHRTL